MKKKSSFENQKYIKCVCAKILLIDHRHDREFEGQILSLYRVPDKVTMYKKQYMGYSMSTPGMCTAACHGFFSF